MKSYGITDIGKQRRTNQDYVFFSDAPIGRLPNLYVVADGMGGHNAGDFASRYTVEKFVDLVLNSTKSGIVSILESAIEMTNSQLMKEAKADEAYYGMGTTFVAAVIDQSTAYVMNIGDSRLYILDQGIMQVTIDHSLVSEMVRIGKITKEEADVHPEKNIITKAVGAVEPVVPDFFEVELKEDQRILLCSDGLTNMVEDHEINEIALRSETNVQLVHNLIERANFYGGRDNITALVIEQE